jgi:hypothetical protein
MNIAQQYFQQQFAVAEFRHAYLEEKTKLDIEYQLEELKKDIQARKSIEELLQKIEHIEQYVMAVWTPSLTSADTLVLQAELARLVYALYGLTYEEVKLIEPEFGMSAEAYHRLTV